MYVLCVCVCVCVWQQAIDTSSSVSSRLNKCSKIPEALKKILSTLAVTAKWIECQPADQRVAG